MEFELKIRVEPLVVARVLATFVLILAMFA
jgi:hypothetical protein